MGGVSIKSSHFHRRDLHPLIYKKPKHTTRSAELLHCYVDSFVIKTNQLGQLRPLTDNQMSGLGSKSPPTFGHQYLLYSTYLGFNFHLVRAAIKPRSHPCSKSAKLISHTWKSTRKAPRQAPNSQKNKCIPKCIQSQQSMHLLSNESFTSSSMFHQYKTFLTYCKRRANEASCQIFEY